MIVFHIHAAQLRTLLFYIIKSQRKNFEPEPGFEPRTLFPKAQIMGLFSINNLIWILFYIIFIDEFSTIQRHLSFQGSFLPPQLSLLCSFFCCDVFAHYLLLTPSVQYCQGFSFLLLPWGFHSSIIFRILSLLALFKCTNHLNLFFLVLHLCCHKH